MRASHISEGSERIARISFAVTPAEDRAVSAKDCGRVGWQPDRQAGEGRLVARTGSCRLESWGIFALSSWNGWRFLLF